VQVFLIGDQKERSQATACRRHDRCLFACDDPGTSRFKGSLRECYTTGVSRGSRLLLRRARSGKEGHGTQPERHNEAAYRAQAVARPLEAMFKLS